MPVNNRIAHSADEVAERRRDFHAHPDLVYDVHRAAGLVADRLREFRCDEVVTGIGRAGVVGVIKGRAPARVIGLRANMDALPIVEAITKPHSSQNPGLMHASGHDGHTAMLLGAAKYLSETRNFAGSAIVISQPAEEGCGGGVKAMIKDGLMTRFDIFKVYGMHSKPGMPIGGFGARPGPIMAAADRFEIRIVGRGAHAAIPQLLIDTIYIASQLVIALKGIAARDVDPLESAVVSTTMVRAGEAFNMLSQEALLRGTVRTFDPATQDLVERRMQSICDAIAAMHDATITLDYERNYPVTRNHDAQTAFATEVARQVAGADHVDANLMPTMGAEGLSLMLQERPGCFIFIGNGDSAGLRHPDYDFDDAAIPIGASYWAKLVETALPA